MYRVIQDFGYNRYNGIAEGIITRIRTLASEDESICSNNKEGFSKKVKAVLGPNDYPLGITKENGQVFEGYIH